MSDLKLSNGDDYPSAARKNLTDAKVLTAQSRYDGSAYLAGYAIECALKTALIIENPSHKMKHHNLDTLSSEILIEISNLTTSRTAKYFRSPFTPPIPYNTPPSGWKETLRYQAEGTISKEVSDQWLSSADEFIKQTIMAMAIDGVITW